MTDRDRLIELIFKSDYSDFPCHLNNVRIDALADYLLANGVIVPPCKVGDIVYVKYSGAIEYFVISKVIHNGSNSFDFEADLENEDGYTIYSIEFGTVEIGRTVFLTKEEAEEKLKELNDNC